MNRMPRIKGKGAQQYHNAVARYNLGENIARHMGFIYSIILFDKFDFSMKKLQNFSDALLELKKRWMDDSNNDITSESLVIYCQKKKINVAGFVKSIPFSQKMFLSDIKDKEQQSDARRILIHHLWQHYIFQFQFLRKNINFRMQK